MFTKLVIQSTEDSDTSEAPYDLPENFGRHPKPVSAKLLRDLRIGELETMARQELADDFENRISLREAVHQATYRVGAALGDIDPDEAAMVIAESVELQAEAEETAKKLRSKPGPKVDVDRLRDVAAIYTRARVRRQPLKRAVAQEVGVSESRAGHLIKQARDRGLLPEAVRGGARQGGPEGREEVR